MSEVPGSGVGDDTWTRGGESREVATTYEQDQGAVEAATGADAAFASELSGLYSVSEVSGAGCAG